MDFLKPPEGDAEHSKEFMRQVEEHYKLLIERSDIHYETIEHRLAKFTYKALIAFAIIGLMSAFALGGFTFVLQSQGQTSKDIQESRYDVIYESCEQQNKRHDSTIQKANNVLPKQSIKTVVLLVNELQPYILDCSGYAKSRLEGN